MLEVKNIVKTYRSKTGETVKALDNVSVSFPESGMVFILGKSGSGKSTLLNVIGGLDSCDSGEFIIQGKSSEDFGGSDYDAYRNTFIGFIFQEYNVLDEFTVGANIAIALELQGKKASAEKINEILSKVDLLSFAKRKPNELSGGQKQRVAIARALVKDPQIIMADEPTGALDSNTGKQIFDALKKLSEEKLVLIVSHDRDFAERYADRIIELSDGRIISDVTKHETSSAKVSEGIDRVSPNVLKIKGGYRLTEKDVEMINEYLKNVKTDVILSGDTRVNDELRSVAGITEGGGTSFFEPTDDKKDLKIHSYDGKKTKFIRSRLPFKNAFKMGASGLKHKRFRLVITILLSVVAFTMFGLSDTMGSYDKISAATRSIGDSNISNASMSLGVRRTYRYRDEESSYYDFAAMNDEDIRSLSEKTGLTFVPVFNGNTYSLSNSFSLKNNTENFAALEGEAYKGRLSGYASIKAADFEKAGLRLTGRMPNTDDEIVISEFICRQLNITGFKNEVMNESIAAGSLEIAESGANSIIGKHISPVDGIVNPVKQLTVVGVVDTEFDYERYKNFLSAGTGGNDVQLTEMLLLNELNDALSYGFHTLGFVTQGYIDYLAAKMPKSTRLPLANSGSYNYTLCFGQRDNGSETDGNVSESIYGIADSRVLSKFPVTYFDGASRAKLADNEYVVSIKTMEMILDAGGKPLADENAVRSAAEEILGSDRVEKAKQLKQNALWNEVYRCAATIKYAEETVKAHRSEIISHYGSGKTDEEYADLLYDDTERGVKWWEGRFETKTADTLYEEFENEFAPRVAKAFGNVFPESAYPFMYSVLVDWQNCYAGEPLGTGYYGLLWVYERYFGYKDVEENNLFTNADLRADMESNGELPSYFDDLSPSEQYYAFVDAYVSFVNSASGMFGYENPYGSYSTEKAREMLIKQRFSAIDAGELNIKIDKTVYEADGSGRWQTFDTLTDCKLVGFFNDFSNEYQSLIISETLYAKATALSRSDDYWMESADHDDGIWAFAVTAMPKDQNTVRKLVELNYEEGGDLQFKLRNQVMNTLDNFNVFIESGAKIFLYVGIGFAVFSALLLMNFISVSISYKKREIGILRAVGARSSDVFGIFFSESFIIAFINYVLSVAGTVLAVYFINRVMRNAGVNVTLLGFGVRQLVLMFAVSFAVAAAASFLPVWFIARKKPVDAIKDR